MVLVIFHQIVEALAKHFGAAIDAPFQDLPQDFKDAAYEQSGGFPLQELLKKAHDDTHPGFQSTWRRVIRALGPQP
jgi:hypothetical protein